MPDNTDILGELGIDPNATPQFGGENAGLSIEGATGMGLITGGEGTEASPYTGMLADILGAENVEGKLKYFEEYDDIKEDMAGLSREQSEKEAQQGYSQALTGAQGQVGQALGQAYAKGRSGGGGFGGSSPSVGRVGQQAMMGYDATKDAAQQQMQGQMFDAQMTEAKAIKASRDAYQQQIMQLLGMLQE
jgi:FtsZ-binding cell division protein ZapB